MDSIYSEDAILPYCIGLVSTFTVTYLQFRVGKGLYINNITAYLCLVVCCGILKVFEVNNINPDQTASKSGFTLLL